jgi:DNA-binding transcriptional MerR regulator
MWPSLLFAIILCCLWQQAFFLRSLTARSPLKSARLYAGSDPKAQKAANDAYKKAQMYLKMKQLREARENGLSLEEYKAKLKSGEKFTSNAGKGDTATNMANISDKIKTQEAMDAYGPKKGYKKFVGAKGSLDSRLRNVIAYKRTNMAA